MVNAGKRLDRMKTEKMIREGVGVHRQVGYESERYNILLQHGNNPINKKQTNRLSNEEWQKDRYDPKEPRKEEKKGTKGLIC